MLQSAYDNKFSTEQEEFWSGEFGEDYIERNTKEDLFFKKTCGFLLMLSKA